MNSPVVDDKVADLVGAVYNAFFKPGNLGSLMNNSPPIWEELSFKLCANGTVRAYDGDPIASKTVPAPTPTATSAAGPVARRTLSTVAGYRTSPQVGTREGARWRCYLFRSSI
ncbi:hypothetical protein AB0N81_29680 [Streptomyces sp. NPDC093510]|uniref:hypothetical protein n=1 Tax=Streptomyces sp. NPDC093510 TaxID=3155199 RepID=UPI003413481E